MDLVDRTLEYLRDERFRRSLRKWVVSFVMLALFTVSELTVLPRTTTFNPNDPSISHPYTQETISSFACLVIAVVVPLVMLGVRERNDLHRANVIGLSFVLSMSINLMVIEVLKNIIGKPRPDFMSRCGPVSSASASTSASASVSASVSVSACVLPPYGRWTLIDGMRSFPSGHLAASFGGLGFLALYLRNSMKAAKRNSAGGFVVQGLPLVTAALIAYSRTRDFRHDVYDVTVGGMFGTCLGVWGWNHVDVESLLKPVLPV